MTRHRLAPEVRSRRAAKRRRTRARRGMSKEDKVISNAYREAIAKDSCFYCGKNKPEMHTDHAFALARGGTNHWWNLRRACAECNGKKGTRCIGCFTNNPCASGCRPVIGHDKTEVYYAVKNPF